jgi:hypothetical protein
MAPRYVRLFGVPQRALPLPRLFSGGCIDTWRRNDEHVLTRLQSREIRKHHILPFGGLERCAQYGDVLLVEEALRLDQLFKTRTEVIAFEQHVRGVGLLRSKPIHKHTHLCVHFFKIGTVVDVQHTI